MRSQLFQTRSGGLAKYDAYSHWLALVASLLSQQLITSKENCMAANTGQTGPDDRWLATLQEEILEPELPIICLLYTSPSPRDRG